MEINGEGRSGTLSLFDSFYLQRNKNFSNGTEDRMNLK